MDKRLEINELIACLLLTQKKARLKGCILNLICLIGHISSHFQQNWVKRSTTQWRSQSFVRLSCLLQDKKWAKLCCHKFGQKMTRLLLLAIGLFVFFVAQCSGQFSNLIFFDKTKVTKDKVRPYDHHDLWRFCKKTFHYYQNHLNSIVYTVNIYRYVIGILQVKTM